jgi:imidazolonepropionase-like amidohydrolase
MPSAAQSVTAFAGARLIVGDGRVTENARLVVDGAKIVQAGAAADVAVPAGATRVSLAGKTVRPMVIDTHVHLGRTRDALVRARLDAFAHEEMLDMVLAGMTPMPVIVAATRATRPNS